MSGLWAEDLSVSLNGRLVLDRIELEIAEGMVSAVIGPNGSGKSTLLRSLARIVRPSGGMVRLDGQDLWTLPSRTRAQRIGFLPQAPVAPEGIRVRALVSRGRTPHQGRFGLLTRADHAAVEAAMAEVGLTPLAQRRVDRLSGGQRQRAWIALTLAQQTPILLLDEPTTFLDPPHQVEILRLLRRLNAETGRTIVMVLHDVILASLFADRVIGLREGRLAFVTEPGAALRADQVEELFGMGMHALPHPTADRPVLVPRL
ncbi:MAG: ABC transporter ATP-binding protein [Pseudomonadota bacterium]